MTAYQAPAGMTVKSFGKLDEYPPGPWTGEPDKAQWIDADTDLDCLIVRNPMGALCGYVGVPPTHPLHGKDYNDVDADVHGGLTFADSCDENRAEQGICHVPAPGREADLWWFGFDCAHYRDLIPRHAGDRWNDGTYKDMSYVAAECATLAKQLRRVSA